MYLCRKYLTYSDMKKILLFLTFLTGLITSGQQKNTLLDRNFWKTNTTVTAVLLEIERGNNPSELDAGAFDPVCIAIMKGVPDETVKFLLKQHGNYIDKLTHDSRTYLHWAALSNNVSLVKYLIDEGSNINATDSRGATPLTFAAERGTPSQALLETFFNAGIDPKATYKNSENILHLVIANDKDLILTNYLLTKGLSLKDTDQNGNTLSDYAAKKGNVELLKVLRKKGVKPTNNALFFAAQGARGFTNKIDIYKYLVEEAKIKPTITNKDGQNVLHFIVKNNNQEEVVKYFINKKVAVNQSDKNGNTPFMNAAAMPNIAVLELLLPKNNINAVNKSGESALFNAVRFSSPEVVEFLLKNNANTKIKDSKDNNLGYHLVDSYRPRANEKQKKEFQQKLKILVENGVDFTALQADGTLYHTAIIKEDLSLLQLLFPLGIDVNTPNKAGETPLMKAAMIAKDDAILKYLISIGADKNAKTEFGETAYELAKENEILTDQQINIDFLK